MEDKFKPGDQVRINVEGGSELTILSKRILLPPEIIQSQEEEFFKRAGRYMDETLRILSKIGYKCEVNKDKKIIWVPEIVLKKVEDGAEKKFWNTIDKYYQEIREKFPINKQGDNDALQ